MDVALKPHPDTTTDAVIKVSVAVHRGTPEQLTLTCGLVGDMNRILVPESGVGGREDELWRHTCFELFVRAQGDAYYEFNFAPSLKWAAYRFDSYRSGMADVTPRRITGLGARAETGGFGGHADLNLGGLSDIDLDAPLRIGLSAVIEEADGTKSYWALAHPEGKPDFHHPAAFAAELKTVVYW